MGAGNAHLKLKISRGEASFEVVAFGQGRWATEFSQTKNLELAVKLSVNQWNGQTALQLMMVDARVEGVQLFNIRGKMQSCQKVFQSWIFLENCQILRLVKLLS